MSSDLQYKLLNLEISPPADSWKYIALQAYKEFDVSEINLSRKLDDTEVNPSQKSWTLIASELWKEATPSRLIPFNIRRAAAAVIVIGLAPFCSFICFPQKGEAPH